jgi:hypothetical protein
VTGRGHSSLLPQKALTLREFDNGYWYVEELRAFAVKMRIPAANKLRKGQPARNRDRISFSVKEQGSMAVARKEGPRDVGRGLRVDLPVVHYTSNKQTESFIEREASKIQPGFQGASRNAICSTGREKNKLPRAASSHTETWYIKRLL